MKHRFRYIISLTLLAIIPEIYFLSRLSGQQILLAFVIALAGMAFIMRADMGTTKGYKTDPKKWVWDFNNESIIGIKIRNLPIEEYLFPLVWIPLPIALWEWVKTMQLGTASMAIILACSILAACIVFPFLAQPDTKS